MQTMGQFIAVLRKSSGLTQKQLAEELNVSDKTISHWERDESAPDLTVIPVIADLFGVTCDELLRGERRPVVGKAAEARAGESGDAGEPTKNDRRAERQLGVLLKTIRLRFLTRSLWVSGGGAVGLCAAFICDLAFNRAWLGFFITLAACVAAAVAETVFLLQGRASLDVDEPESELIAGCRHRLFRIAFLVYGLLAGEIAFTVPLIRVPSPYYGLKLQGWLMTGLLFVSAVAAAALVLLAVIHRKALIRALIRAVKRDKYCALKGKCLLFTVLALLAAYGLQYLMNNFLLYPDGLPMIPGTEFSSWEAFAAYMEREADGPFHYDGEPVFDEEGDTPDAERNEVIEITAKDGTLLARVEVRNHQVCSERSWDADGMPVYTVYTREDLLRGMKKKDNVNFIYAGTVYPLTAACGVMIYFIRRKKKAGR